MGLRVIFLCGHLSPYGRAHLEPILDSAFDVVAVVLADNQRWDHFREVLSGRKHLNFKRRSEYFCERTKNYVRRFIGRFERRFLRPSIRQICRERNIPLWYVNDVNAPHFIEKIANLDADLIVSAAYPQIFSIGLIGAAKVGSVNFHPSLLPKFRGAHPHFWAIARGASHSGLTAHFMTNEIDKGDIIEQISYPIHNLSYSQLYKKMVEVTPSFVKRVEAFFTSGNKSSSPQVHSDATYFTNDRDIHHRIFWDIQSAEEINNLIRTGRAYCFFRNARVIILEAYVADTNRNLTNEIRVPPGVVVDFLEDALIVKAIDGCVCVRTLKMRGKQYRFDKWIKKTNVDIGERFL